MTGALLTVAIAACGSTGIVKNDGPFASPPQSPPAKVLSRVCSGQTPADRTADTQFMSILLIREGTQLGRVSDDLSGAVPGGNFPVDADLAFKTAQELQTLVDQSRLCEPLKTTLSKAVKTMVEADQVLVNSGGGPDAAAALSDAQSRYQDLQNLVSNPPDATGAASPSPSP